MPTRPFLVLPNRVCIPLEGAWRIAELRGDWYVLGNHSVVPCGSKNAAESMLDELQSQTEFDVLANEAVIGIDDVSNLRSPSRRAPEARRP